jgi:hypothetical protein
VLGEADVLAQTRPEDAVRPDDVEVAAVVDKLRESARSFRRSDV